MAIIWSSLSRVMIGPYTTLCAEPLVLQRRPCALASAERNPEIIASLEVGFDLEHRLRLLVCCRALHHPGSSVPS